MTPEQILHTWARRYASERFEHWVSEYSRIYRPNRRGDYSKAEHQIFPRYNVASDIRRDIELHDFERLPEFEGLLASLQSAAEVVGPSTTGGDQDPVAARAETEERQNWAVQVSKIAHDLPDWIEPLPYRKTLGAIETAAIAHRLNQKWGVREGEYFYPLSNKTHSSLIAISGADDSGYGEVRKRIDRFFEAQQIDRVYAFYEFGRPYHHIADVSALDIWYGDGGEGYWFDEDMNWLVYCSHESTMTLGGTIAAVIDLSDPRIILGV